MGNNTFDILNFIRNMNKYEDTAKLPKNISKIF